MYVCARLSPLLCPLLVVVSTGQEWRADLKTINITQPEGPSFTIEGNLVTWQKWRLRIGFNGREGLVLHNVGFQDEGRVRPVLHRASLSEMAVPYGEDCRQLLCGMTGHRQSLFFSCLAVAATNSCEYHAVLLGCGLAMLLLSWLRCSHCCLAA